MIATRLLRLRMSISLSATLLVWILMAGGSLAANPLEGYRSFGGIQTSLEELAASEYAQLDSLVTTAAGLDVWLLSLGSGDLASKPAFAVFGAVDARQPAGAELSLRMAEGMIEAAEAGGEGAALLTQYTFYFVPIPSPDEYERCFDSPCIVPMGNARSMDEDDDFETDEDGTEDLNGDGLITMMRVAKEGGPYRTHPADPRVMIRVEKDKNEVGGYLLFPEGIDNDEDENYNEDGPGGVAFNRNFAYNYPYFAAGAGPHQVSEPETRAIADFCFDHPNIALMFSFSPEDNLMHPWKSSGGGGSSSYWGGGKVSSIKSGDAKLLEYIAEEYQELHPVPVKVRDLPGSPKGQGSFTEWAYYHFGRMSFVARGYWPVPDPDAEPENEEAAEPEAEESAAEPEEEPEDVGDRGEEDLAQLAWLAETGIMGFVDWTPVEHPGFPDQLVEVGGFAPFVLHNPPADQLDELATSHLDFLRWLTGLMPVISIDEVEVEELGGGLFRVQLTLANFGYLPTTCEMGEHSRVAYPLMYELGLPEGAELIGSYPRGRVRSLSGNGGSDELSWLILAERDSEVAIRIAAPAVGEIDAVIVLNQDADQPGGEQ